jgi:opacity protein-like surface antigen
MHTLSRIVRADKPLTALAAFAALAMSAALSADSAQAQARYLVSPFAARNGSLDGTPALVGAA